MTVMDLIKELQKYPTDMNVCVCASCECLPCDISGIDITKDDNGYKQLENDVVCIYGS